jgi:hypothetical protein
VNRSSVIWKKIKKWGNVRVSFQHAAQGAARFLNAGRTQFLLFLRNGTDVKRWRQHSNLDPDWDSRTQLLASFVPAGASVLEFGAGRMVLKRHLPVGCRYTPSDLVDRGSGTVVIDLNAPLLPRFIPHDVAVFSGVLEYVHDVPRLISALAGTSRIIIASYVTSESVSNRIQRRSNGWVNTYSTVEFEEIFTANGFAVRQTTTWQNQNLWMFERPKPS